MSVQTATLEIKGLRFETLTELGVKALELGKSVEEYACELIENGLARSKTNSDDRIYGT